MSKRCRLFAWPWRSILGLLMLTAFGLTGPDANASDRWLEIKQGIAGGREILDGRAAGIVDIEAPERAYDAAIVPVTMRALIPQTRELYIRKLYLVVDMNPVPLAGTFRFGDASGRATIETRIRVNDYTDVRVLAETSDDKLYMAKTFVKASGGCSAPALADMEAAMSRIGRMKFRVDEGLVAGRPATAQLLLSHPNSSGMQFDQVSRTYIPAHFVHEIDIRYNDHSIVNIETNFSMSENPSIGFTFVPESRGEIRVHAVDSRADVFEQRWSIDAPES